MKLFTEVIIPKLNGYSKLRESWCRVVSTLRISRFQMDWVTIFRKIKFHHRSNWIVKQSSTWSEQLYAAKSVHFKTRTVFTLPRFESKVYDLWNLYWNIHCSERFSMCMYCKRDLFVFPWICKFAPTCFLCLHVASWIYCIWK